MTTTDKPAESSTRPKYEADVYEVQRAGRTYECRKMEYRGDVYEVCSRVLKPGEASEPLIPRPFVRRGDPGYDELVAYLDQFLIPHEESSAE